MFRGVVGLAWSDGTFVKTDAIVVGSWCVHAAPFPRNGYRVSYIANGRGLYNSIDELSRRDALAIARRLNDIPQGEVESPDGGYMIEAIMAEVLG